MRAFPSSSKQYNNSRAQSLPSSSTHTHTCFQFSIQIQLKNTYKALLYIYIYTYKYTHIERLTIARAVMDSFIHRFSSSKWPIMMQAQRSATKRLIEATEVWSEVIVNPIDFAKIEPISIAITTTFSSSTNGTQFDQFSDKLC